MSRTASFSYQRGRLVTVRSADEIRATLDAQGKLDGVSFMPEMLRYCGMRIAVFRRADRTCVAGHDIRRMRQAVFLQDTRCDGAFHGGCGRACMIFWKEQWLRPASEGAHGGALIEANPADASRWAMRFPTQTGDIYHCQSTELLAATSPLSRWSIAPFMAEIRHGELALLDFVRIVVRTLLHRFLGVTLDRKLAGTCVHSSRGDLNLREGELVVVKQADEIEAFLDRRGGNCGLGFQPTMNRAIGKRFEVAFPIHRIILEQTGKMVHLKNTVVLKGMTCGGVCAANCPRGEHLFWRESWLRRVGDEAA